MIDPRLPENDTETIAAHLAAENGEDYAQADSLRQLHWIGEALAYIVRFYDDEQIGINNEVGSSLVQSTGRNAPSVFQRYQPILEEQIR